jgi:dephospho-CoA kinase
MILIGLTGILGSGKSTVAALLRKRGLDVIDLDALSKDSLNWKETRSEIRKVFGEEYVVNDTVDVEKLRKMVFSKDERLRMLEGIIHPRVREEVKKRLSALETKGAPVVVIDHPLLFETGFQEKLDKVIVVTADMETIKERLKKRGMTMDDAERRLSFQIPLKEKEQMADYVIDNNGTEYYLEGQVDSLFTTIISGRKP